MPKTSWPTKSLLSLALLVASWQFCASGFGQTVIIISPDIVARQSIDCSCCVMPENKEGQPPQNSAPSDSPSDLEDSNGGLEDLSADTSTRNDQDTPLFSVTGVDAVTLRTPRIVPILLVPVHCFYCLHEHIRERAPPVPV
jgi:hypothetical protein